MKRSNLTAVASLLRSSLVLAIGLLSALQTAPAITMNAPAQVTFAAYDDPWPAAQERWWDIDNNPYKDWLTNGNPNGKFDYTLNPRVTLTYDTAPSVPYFVGRIDATNLKPNFCYQLKLLGKPVYGSRGMGKTASWIDFSGVTHRVGTTPVNGNDWANEQIGNVGRWWDDNNQAPGTNLDDNYYQDYYKNPALTGVAAPSSPRIHTVYGYHFMGSFVTNSKGEAHVDFTGRYSYHIDWASWQGGIRDVVHGTFPVRGWLTRSNPPYYYAYGATAPSSSVTLYYEYESDRANPVQLRPGTYHCRFMLTEESFHNSSFNPLGGYWKSVLATEDFDATGRPDTNVANDVVFRISRPAPQPAPLISSFSPARGAVGTAVLITGTNLQNTSAVRFEGRAATFTRVSNTQVRAVVPLGALSGRISVTTPAGTAFSRTTFTVTPAITSISPASGPVRTVVKIIGTTLNGTTSVRFNGVPATFVQATASDVRATVPAGATTGKISLTTPTGTATSTTTFTVTR